MRRKKSWKKNAEVLNNLGHEEDPRRAQAVLLKEHFKLSLHSFFSDTEKLSGIGALMHEQIRQKKLPPRVAHRYTPRSLEGTRPAWAWHRPSRERGRAVEHR